MHSQYWDRLPIEIKLQIANHCSISTLSRLMQVDQTTYSLLHPRLYRRNSFYFNSSAIFWAAANCTRAKYEKSSLGTLSKAIENGGNVNVRHKGINDCEFTALHVAALMGGAEFVKRLLDAGAKVRALCYTLPYSVLRIRSLSKMRDETIRLGAELSSAIWTRTQWYPLMIPFVMRNIPIVRLLIDAGAPGELGVEIARNQAPGERKIRAVTIHHVLASSREMMDMDWHGECLVCRFRDCINTRLPGSGATALHLAIDSASSQSFLKFLDAGADLESLSDIERTPLCHAIAAFVNCDDWCLLNLLLNLIALIVKRGADVNTTWDVGGTPLMCLLNCNEAVSEPPPRMLKAAVNLLLDQGADINRVTPAGDTVIHCLYKTIQRLNGDRVREDILTKLVERGADLQFPIHGYVSLLKMNICDDKMKPLTLFRLLVKLGARLFDYEVDDVFLAWALRRQGLPQPFDIADYKEKVSQHAIDKAYSVLFHSKSNANMIRLQALFPFTGIGERLVMQVLYRTPVRKLPPSTQSLSFDPNWISWDGESFLHMVVNRALCSNEVTTTSFCFANATTLIELGARVTHKNRRGMTVVQRMKIAGPRYHNLYVLFSEQLSKELGVLKQ